MTRAAHVNSILLQIARGWLATLTTFALLLLVLLRLLLGLARHSASPRPSPDSPVC